MLYSRMDKWYDWLTIQIKKLSKKRDTSKYSFEYDSDGKPMMAKKYYGTKDV